MAGRRIPPTFDRARLGDLSGLRAVHLPGVDLSSVSIAGATELAQRAGTDVTFVEADVYSAVEVLGGERVAWRWMPLENGLSSTTRNAYP